MEITNVEGIAKILKVPTSSVMRYVREGKIKFLRIGKHRRFNVDEVLKACAKESNFLNS
ncbi:MAG: helix-turn-helix domain-containing protein [Candidatus Omnitrophica bacterium]|nr:helix-turn-helix domain-containing protein [Candidatus Omnitrophota bacterium]